MAGPDAACTRVMPGRAAVGVMGRTPARRASSRSPLLARCSNRSVTRGPTSSCPWPASRCSPRPASPAPGPGGTPAKPRIRPWIYRVGPQGVDVPRVYFYFVKYFVTDRRQG
ncbi:hypothetical protein FRAHR75_290045 [Frankia sp. Hr75.2]|nr:hypothetical protein FRAHR75_290045 [Frankia sp. Hr75.2]